MKKYRVTIPYACYVMAEVEAEDGDSAIELAREEAIPSHYCGNGGNDKLIGVYGENVSIEVGDSDIEGIGDFKIEIEEI